MWSVGLVLALGGLAQAQDRGENTDGEPAPELEPADAEARSLFEIGRTAFEQRRYDDAHAYFERSYEASGQPDLLYNLGVVCERLGRDEEAVRWFERYLEARPNGPHTREVLRRLEELGARVAAEEASAPSAAPWIVLSVAGAVAIAGMVFAIVSGSAQSEVEDAPAGTFWVEVENDAHRAELYSWLGFTMIGVGVAAIAGSVLWLALGPTEDSQVAIGPGRLAWRARF